MKAHRTRNVPRCGHLGRVSLLCNFIKIMWTLYSQCVCSVFRRDNREDKRLLTVCFKSVIID